MNQEPKSLADQQTLLTRWVADRFEGSVEWKFIVGQGSGENLDRRQVTDAEELLAGDQYDLVVMEDLSRHLRCVHAVPFAELCDDMGTRFVAVNDGLDTARQWRLPWKRTRFPGQHAVCWYCGRQYVWGGNGTPKSLMCSGARQWLCWNSFSIHGPQLAETLVQTITDELYRLGGFDAQFREMVQRVLPTS